MMLGRHEIGDILWDFDGLNTRRADDCMGKGRRKDLLLDSKSGTILVWPEFAKTLH